MVMFSNLSLRRIKYDKYFSEKFVGSEVFIVIVVEKGRNKLIIAVHYSQNKRY